MAYLDDRATGSRWTGGTGGRRTGGVGGRQTGVGQPHNRPAVNTWQTSGTVDTGRRTLGQEAGDSADARTHGLLLGVGGGPHRRRVVEAGDRRRGQGDGEAGAAARPKEKMKQLSVRASGERITIYRQLITNGS